MHSSLSDMDDNDLYIAGVVLDDEDSEQTDIEFLVEKSIFKAWSSSDEDEDEIMDAGLENLSSNQVLDQPDQQKGMTNGLLYPSLDNSHQSNQFSHEMIHDKQYSMIESKNSINFDIKKTEVGPDGEITTITKSLTFKLDNLPDSMAHQTAINRKKKIPAGVKKDPDQNEEPVSTSSTASAGLDKYLENNSEERNSNIDNKVLPSTQVINNSSNQSSGTVAAFTSYLKTLASSPSCKCLICPVNFISNFASSCSTSSHRIEKVATGTEGWLC
jgi:hypothetical protein